MSTMIDNITDRARGLYEGLPSRQTVAGRVRSGLVWARDLAGRLFVAAKTKVFTLTNAVSAKVVIVRAKVALRYATPEGVAATSSPAWGWSAAFAPVAALATPGVYRRAAKALGEFFRRGVLAGAQASAAAHRAVHARLARVVPAGRARRALKGVGLVAAGIHAFVIAVTASVVDNLVACYTDTWTESAVVWTSRVMLAVALTAWVFGAGILLSIPGVGTGLYADVTRPLEALRTVFSVGTLAATIARVRQTFARPEQVVERGEQTVQTAKAVFADLRTPDAPADAEPAPMPVIVFTRTARAGERFRIHGTVDGVPALFQVKPAFRGKKLNVTCDVDIPAEHWDAVTALVMDEVAAHEANRVGPKV